MRQIWLPPIALVAAAVSLPPASAGEEPAAPAADWYAPLKNIPLGPGHLDIDVNLRTRFEYSDDFSIRGYRPHQHDDLLLLRTQVGFDYRLSKDAHAYLQFQDARFWMHALDRDDWAENCPYFDQADVRQAYLEWQHIGGSPVGFKVGRQVIAYADNRVFGPGDWGNVGRYWWDAAKLSLDAEAVQVDLLFGQRIVSEPIRWNEKHYDFDMMGLYAQVKRLPCRLDAFYLLRYDDHGSVKGERGTGDERTHTVGFHLDGRTGPWDWGGTFAGQFGAFGRDRTEAYGANARLGHTFDHPWKPRLAAEVSYASGDRDPADGRHGTFDGVFGAIDSYYGRMNFLAWMNLVDYQVTFGVEPRKGLRVWVDYHYFRLASDTDAWYWCSGRPARRDPTGRAGGDLGHEVDLLAKVRMSKNLELFAGYSHFFPGAFLRNTGGGHDDADWAFVQFQFMF